MEKIASITKYRDKDKTIEWLQKLPSKYSFYRIRNILLLLRVGDYILWTEKHGIKIL